MVAADQSERLAEVARRIDECIAILEQQSGLRPWRVPDQDNIDGADPYYGEEGGRLFLCAQERGKLIRDEEHVDVESLVEAIVTPQVVQVAMTYEARHRRPKEDSRRQWFHLSEHWLGTSEPAWGDRLHAHHARVLQSAPFVDTHEQWMAAIAKAEAVNMAARRQALTVPDPPVATPPPQVPPTEGAGRPEWMPWLVAVAAVGFGICGVLRVIEAVVEAVP